MSEPLSFAIRDLVPHPDLFERPAERELRLHHVAEAQLRRKYKTFHPEITLSATVQSGGQDVVIKGRLDGWRRTPKGIILYEIKSVPGDPRRWVDSPLLQNARWQLQLYADLARACIEKPWGKGEVSEAVLCLISETQRQALESVEIRSSAGLLQDRLKVVLAASRPWRANVEAARQALDSFLAVDQLTDRPEQCAASQRIAEESTEDRVLLSMPPGTGKTRVALRHALRESFARKRRLYWITTKARGRDEVLAELDRYRAAGVPLRVLWKTTRERLCDCALPGTSCPRRMETRAALFVDPLPEFHERSSWTFDDLAAYAREHSLCLFELSTALERMADVIIADINYLLNPSPLFARESVLVLDEAQNIARRVYENSEVRIRRDELYSLLEALPLPARRLVRDVLSQRQSNEDTDAAVAESLIALREQLTRVSSHLPAVRAIRRAARFRMTFGEDYRLAWYRRSPDSALIGTLNHASTAVDAALSEHQSIIALSGSLPADSASRAALFPPAQSFRAIEVEQQSTPPVFIIPELIFKYPLTSTDHQSTIEMLRQLREHLLPTIVVFGQNRASNELLSMGLRVRGFTVMLDEDLHDDWSTAAAARPDFLFIAMGGSLSEAVNPPAELFSSAAILSPAFRAPDEYDLLRSATRRGGSDGWNDDVDVDIAERRAEAASRVIQAAGRVQRDPASRKPVFLLNSDFADPAFLRAWPRGWYARSPEEMICSSMSMAFERWNGGAYVSN
jgi:hypothetical protein